jgi:hypothetical protein
MPTEFKAGSSQKRGNFLKIPLFCVYRINHRSRSFVTARAEEGLHTSVLGTSSNMKGLGAGELIGG